tara:strand:- start:114 stop:794 length:681 start_codon:yes stop_codon:yes gene_type:complete
MLSILIPCFNEEKVISESTKKILSWQNKQNFKSELILINNASTDKTLQEMNKFNKENNVKILNEPCKGKGFAVKKGLQNSKYTKAVILDADLSASINELNNEWLKKDNLLIIGSRPLGNEVNTPKIRKLSGYILNYLIRKIFKLNFRDTQCGFKYLSTKDFKKIAEQITCGGFLYDLDLILNCLLLDITVQEEPVKYNFNRESSVSLLKDPLIMLKDIYLINKKYK